MQMPAWMSAPIEPGKQMAFMKVEEDKDGKIFHSEWETVKPNTVYRLKHWPLYDKNRDMSITSDEAPFKEDGSEPAPE
jgi:hypothetical protein